MTKPLPWILAALIFLIGGTAYLIWRTRPRAVTAPLKNAAQKTKNPNSPSENLHPQLVEGCNREFMVRPGEILEPRVLPGASLDKFRSVYGKESEKEKSGPVTWDLYAYSFTDSNFGAGKTSNYISVDMNPGHVLKTLDGVELGIDTFGTILQRAKDGRVPVHESITHEDGKWTLTLSLYSACSRKFRSEYHWTIDSSPVVDHQILPENNSKDPASPWISDVFLNKFVNDFDMGFANGTDLPSQGHPSIHPSFSNL